MYLLRTPKWLRNILPDGQWEMPVSESEPVVYLTFDDGPHPRATPFVLAELDKFEAKATFFCVGKNVVEYPVIFDQIIKAGHKTGNHTHNHLKGWKTNTQKYIEDVRRAQQYIDSNLFRPPYGKIKKKQAAALRQSGYKIVLWSLLSGDFDQDISAKRCLENVVLHLRPGDIVVFHDSQKAWNRLQYALPRVLEHCKIKGWDVKAL